MNHTAVNNCICDACNKCGLILKDVYSFIGKVFKSIWRIGGMYIIWCTLHYVSSQLYSYYCTPSSIIGFLIAPFIIATPQCTALRWCITHGADTIITMWILLGTWCSKKLGGYALH